MTFWDMLALAKTRWIVTLSGFILTGLALAWVLSPHSVYFIQVRVVLLPPASVQENPYATSSASLISMAGAVERAMRGGGEASVVSDDVTLVDEGYRHGYTVRQPNEGSQWNYQFTSAALNVQAVGLTPEDATAQIDVALKQVQSVLTSMQDSQGVDARSRIRTRLSPNTPQLYEEQGSPVRAASITVLAGAIITLVVLAGLGPRRAAEGRRARLRDSARLVTNPHPVASAPARRRKSSDHGSAQEDRES